MVKAVALLSLVPLASAFVIPSGRMAPRSRSIMMSSVEPTEAGVTAPLGYWDPLGFSKDADSEKFRQYRAAEIKHGRIAQLAMLHYFVTNAGIRLPGLVSAGDGIPDSIPAGFNAITSGAWPTQGWAQVLLFCSALEILAPQKPEKDPGDVQPDTSAFPKFEDKSPDQALDYANKELNNGRLAMIAWLGATVQAALTNGEYPVTQLLEKLGNN